MADISKINAVLIANIAEIDDVLAANIAKVNGLVFSTAPAFTGLLDTYTGAAAAYSTRRLYGQYTGAALRVREDATDTETDIGFDSNGDLDTAAIATHCGSANGYVTKWYGQESSGGTGSGLDAAQTTNANQPQIYNGTAVITENGKPAVEFDGTNDRLDAGDNGDTTGNLSIFGVGQSNITGANFGPLIAKSAAAGVPNRWSAGLRRSIYKDSTGTGPTLDMTQDYTQQLASYIYLGGSSATIYQDGSQDVTASLSGSAGDNSYHLLVGGYGDSTGTGGVYQTHNGTIQEVVYYNADKSTDRSGIEGNVNAHYLIGNFGTPTSGLLATYTGAAAAYSVRQLANTAALAMRIREDGTDTETDIGFDSNGDLDTAAIASHCGTNNGYTVTWYDQSGNQVDATQGTSGSQPQIYNGTAVLTENGKPTIDYNGSQSLLMPANTIGASTSMFWTLNAVTAFKVFLGANNSNYMATNTSKVFANIGNNLSDGADTPSGQTLYSHIRDGSTAHNWYKNNTALTTTGPLTNQDFSDPDGTQIGGHVLRWNSDIQEFILYNTDQSSNRSGIETNINSEYLIYQPTDAPTSGLLATYTGAAAAYSVRQLSDKAVIAMRIRRDSDDAETNIGFDSNGDLDTTAISDFCSTANGYVVEWADQSTNGNHASQSTGTSQPQIYNGSAVITNNGVSAVQFDNSGTDRMFFTQVTTVKYITAVCGTDGTGFSVLLSKDTASTSVDRSHRVINGNKWYFDNTGAEDWFKEANGDAYINGTQVTGRPSAASQQLVLAWNTSPSTEYGFSSISTSKNSRGWYGKIQEIIIYENTDYIDSTNRSGIETNTNNYFSIY